MGYLMVTLKAPNGCDDPQKCAEEALTRLNLIPSKYNPTRQDPLDSWSLTKSRKVRNQEARQHDEVVIFNTSMTYKESLAECFRIFMDPTKLNNQLA